MPRKVVVFSCGGGSFIEYEQFMSLNKELGLVKADQGTKAKGDGGGGSAASVS